MASVASSSDSLCGESYDESLYVDGTMSVVEPRSVPSTSQNGSNDRNVEAGNMEDPNQSQDSLSLENSSYTGNTSEVSDTMGGTMTSPNHGRSNPKESWLPRWSQHAPHTVKIILAVSILLLLASNVLAAIAIIGASRGGGSEVSTASDLALPTSEPSTPPSSSPSTVFPTLSPTITCEDSTDIFIVAGEEHTCRDLEESFALRLIVCREGRGVRDSCRMTCGVCQVPT